MSLSVWCVEHPTRTRERRAPRCAFSLFHVGPASRNCFFFPAGSATYIRSSARLNDLRSPPKDHTTLVTRVPLRSHVFPTLNRFADVQPPLPTPRSHLSTWHGLTHNPLRTNDTLLQKICSEFIIWRYFSQDAIVAAAADELGDFSGSAEGSPAPETKPRKGGNTGAGDKNDAKHDNKGKEGKAGADKKRKAEKKVEAEVSDDDDAGEEIELGPNGKPKLPRPEGIAPCPRCHSEETKFCYYNNYNVKQPRYFCRGCQRYWTAGGMLRNVPVGAGRRKNKNGAGELSIRADAAAASAAGRILAGVADAGRHPLGGLAHAAAAAAGVTRDRRGGSSDGSATEAEGAEDFGRAAAAVSAAADFASLWPAAFGGAAQRPAGGSSGEGSADGASGAGTASVNPMDFGAMFGANAANYANPFFAAQAAASQMRQGAASPWPGMGSASDMAFAQMAQMAQMAQAQAQHAAAAAAASADGGLVQQQQQQAAAAYAAAQTFAAARGGFNPFFPQASSPAPGSPTASGLHKPTASAFSSLPSHLQRQLSTQSSALGDAPTASAAPASAPAETATAADKAAVLGAPAAAAPGPGFRAPDATAGAKGPNWAAMLSVMGPAMAAMQQYQATPAANGAAQQGASSAASASTAAAAAAAAGFNPHQMQQIATALASGGYNPFAAPVAGATETAAIVEAKPAAVAEPTMDGSADDSAPPSTGPSRVVAQNSYREVGEEGAKRFKVSEDRAGHAG